MSHHSLCYQDNRSLLEACRRVGAELNEYEIRNILAASQGKSEWKRIEPDSLDSRASAIGRDCELSDGSLCVRISGNWIMAYSTKLDSCVKERLRIIKERQVNQQEEKARIQQIEAPGGTSGFWVIKSARTVTAAF